MNASLNVPLVGLEIGVLVLALGVLLLDLWVPPENRRQLGYVAAIGVALILILSFIRAALLSHAPRRGRHVSSPEFAFGQSYVMDDLALFFKRFFLAGAVIVLLMSAEFAGRLEPGISEFYSLICSPFRG